MSCLTDYFLTDLDGVVLSQTNIVQPLMSSRSTEVRSRIRVQCPQNQNAVLQHAILF